MGQPQSRERNRWVGPICLRLRLLKLEGLDSAHKDQDQDDHQYDAEDTRRCIAEAARVAPIWQGANQQKNKDDDKDCTETHRGLHFVFVTLWVEIRAVRASARRL